jgi:hypothetical protein
LGELRDKQAENKKGKQAKNDQLAALSISLKKKVLFEPLAPPRSVNKSMMRNYCKFRIRSIELTRSVVL